MTALAKSEAAQASLPADPMVSMIERLVMDPKSDLDKLERMLSMKERLDADSRKRMFNEAMSACQAEIAPIARNKRNSQTDSNYADLAAIYKAAKPILDRHGFSFSTFPASSEKQGYMGIRWVLRHSAGHEEADVAEIAMDDRGLKGNVNKTQTHAFGSTASYARRYLFCMIFDIATEDNDGNQRAPDTVSAEQFIALRTKLEESGMAPKLFHQAFGHKDPDNANLTEFPAARFSEAMERLSQYMLKKAQNDTPGANQ